MSVCVYMFVCTYVCVCVCVCECMYAYVSTRMHVCMCMNFIYMYAEYIFYIFARLDQDSNSTRMTRNYSRLLVNGQRNCVKEKGRERDRD